MNNNTEHSYQQAMQFLQQGRYLESQILFEQLLQEWPDNASLLDGLARAELRLGRYTSAVALWKRIPPDANEDLTFASLQMKLGVAHLLFGRKDDAERFLSSAETDGIKIFKGYLLCSNGELERARKIFSELLDPSEEKSSSVAQAYAKTGYDIADFGLHYYAKTLNENAVEAGPRITITNCQQEDIDEIRILASICLSALKLYKFSHQLLNEIIRHHESNPINANVAYLRKAKLFEYEGQFQQAFDSCRIAIDFDPNNKFLKHVMYDLRMTARSNGNLSVPDANSEAAIIEAIELGDLYQLRIQYRDRMRPLGTPGEFTWLHRAVMLGVENDILEFIIYECGVNPFAVDSDGKSALFYAVDHRQLEPVIYLTRLPGINLNTEYPVQSIVLDQKALEQKDQEQKISEPKRETILRHALRNGCPVAIVVHLLPKQYDFSKALPEPEIMPALHLAAETGHINAITHFVKQLHADIESVAESNKLSVLQHACYSNQFPSVVCLAVLDAKVDLNLDKMQEILKDEKVHEEIKTYLTEKAKHVERVDAFTSKESTRISDEIKKSLKNLEKLGPLTGLPKHLKNHPKFLKLQPPTVTGQQLMLDNECAVSFASLVASSLKLAHHSQNHGSFFKKPLPESRLVECLHESMDIYTSEQHRPLSHWRTFVNEAVADVEEKLPPKMRMSNLAQWIEDVLTGDGRLINKKPNQQLKDLLFQELRYIRATTTQTSLGYRLHYVIDAWISSMVEVSENDRYFHTTIMGLIYSLQGYQIGVKNKRVGIIYGIIKDVLLHYANGQLQDYLLTNLIKASELFSLFTDQLKTFNAKGLVENEKNQQNALKAKVTEAIHFWVRSNNILLNVVKSNYTAPSSVIRLFRPQENKDEKIQPDRNIKRECFINCFGETFINFVYTAELIRAKLVDRKITKNEQKAELGASVAKDLPVKLAFSVPLPVGPVPLSLSVDTNKLIEGGFKLWGYYCKITDENRIEVLAKFFASRSFLEKAQDVHAAAGMIFDRYEMQLTSLKHVSNIGLLKAATFAAVCVVNYLVGEKDCRIESQPGMFEAMGHSISRLFASSPDVLVRKYHNETITMYNGVVYGEIDKVSVESSPDSKVVSTLHGEDEAWDMSAMFRNPRIRDEFGILYTTDKIEEYASEWKVDFGECKGSQIEAKKRGFREATQNENNDYNRRFPPVAPAHKFRSGLG